MHRTMFVCLLTLVALSARAAGEVPAQSGEFLAYCKTDNDGCTNKISEISFAMLVSNSIDHKWCPTKETEDVKIVTSKVVQWLTAHPEAKSTKTNDGIQLALVGLYPCKR